MTFGYPQKLVMYRMNLNKYIFYSLLILLMDKITGWTGFKYAIQNIRCLMVGK